MLNIKAILLSLLLIPVAFLGLVIGFIRTAFCIPTETYDMVVDMLDGKLPDAEDQ